MHASLLSSPVFGTVSSRLFGITRSDSTVTEAASDSMRRHRPHPIGLKPTLRHMMIVILWAALVLAVLRMLMLGGLFVAPPQIVCLNVATIVAAWPMLILAVLILALDRWGPVRDWYFACCQIAWSALAGAVFLLVDPVCSSLSGQPTVVFPVLPFLGVACLWGGTMQLRAAWPGACPRCGHRTIIATRGRVQGAARGRRNMVRGWCATCGAAYQREGLTAWRPEAGEGAELDFPDVR